MGDKIKNLAHVTTKCYRDEMYSRGSTLIDFRKESPLKLWDYAPKRLSSHFMFTFMIMDGLAPSPPRCRMRLLFFLIATYESSKSHVTCQPGPHLSSSAT